MIVDRSTAEAMVYGGAVLGGGGGGSLDEGLHLAGLAVELGSPHIISLDRLEPDDLVVTVSLVGAPAALSRFVNPMDYVRSLEMLISAMDRKPVGLIQNEMGGLASANGLIQSAVVGLPLIDAPCNGRAYPLSVMGSMGLHKRPDYVAMHAACGGDPKAGRQLEVLVKGGVDQCAAMIRMTSIEAGGLIAVARNPVRADWLRENAAPEALTKTINLGWSILKTGAGHIIQAVVEQLGGEIVVSGTVSQVELTTQGGFDAGQVTFDTGHELAFWNEYILLEIDGRRLYTFPDLITTFDSDSNLPVNTADIKENMSVAVMAAGKEHLALGTGLLDPDLYRRVEQAVGRSVIKYAFGGD
jgi:DUF917 family protein